MKHKHTMDSHARQLRYTVLMSSLLLAFGARAQENAAPTPGEQATKGQIQEVVITAERHRSSVQKTAASVTAVTGAELQAKGQTTVESALRDVPAVEMQASPQGGQIYIRGVGANGDSNWVDPSVSLMFDNVYSGRAERVFASMYDVDRVEILRGPQGTLYGRNATGGTVNVLTKNPVDSTEGAINFQVGNYGLKHVDGVYNKPINETLALRLALLREKRNGYFSNSGDGSDLKGARLKALWKPSANFSVLASIDTLQQTGLGVTTASYSYTPDVPPFVNWPTYPAQLHSPWTVDDLHPAEVRRTKFTTYLLEANWDLGWGVATFVPAYTKSTRDSISNLITGTAIPPGVSPSTWSEDQSSAELRVASAARSPVRWVAGLYHFKSNNAQSGNMATLSQYSWESYGVSAPADSNAVFGQVIYPLTPALRLTGGMRYTKDRKTYHYGVHSLDGAYDTGMLSTVNSYSAFTYKAGIEYDVNRNSMMYAQVASGYKAGGFSTTATPPTAYGPEKLTALELGSKNRFLGGRLQVNAEVYYYLYKNYQIQYGDFGALSPNPNDPVGTTYFAQYVVNADTGRNKGGDVEAKYRITPDDELRVGMAYTHARYGNFAQPALAYLNGTPVANTPARTANIGYRHEWNLDSGAEWSLGAEMKFSDNYRVTLLKDFPGGDLNVHQAGYRRTDLYLNYHSADGNWTAALWAKNLEDKAQVTNALPFGRVQITNPRTFGVNLGYSF